MDGVISAQARDPIDSLNDPMGLLTAKLLLPTGVDGLYGRSGTYEEVVDGLFYLISRYREPGTEVVRFPPVMNRHVLEKSGYLKSFPNLLGCVCALHGSERDIRSAADRGQPLRCRRRLDHLALAGRSRAVAGGLLSGLPDGRRPRPAAGRRPALRRRLRLLSPRTLAQAGSPAIVPDA